MTPIVQLTHFLRGEVTVQPVIIDGRQEWTCPDRPMMRPWPHCYFVGPPDEIEARWLAAYQFLVEGVGHNADRPSLST